MIEQFSGGGWERVGQSALYSFSRFTSHNSNVSKEKLLYRLRNQCFVWENVQYTHSIQTFFSFKKKES